MFGFVRGPAAGKHPCFTLGPAVVCLRRINERGGENTNEFAGIAGAPFRDNQNSRSLQHV